VTDPVMEPASPSKSVIDEDGTRRALSLRKHRLFAPELLVTECANVLWMKTRRGEFSPDEAGSPPHRLSAKSSPIGYKSKVIGLTTSALP
jgi:hypothetical protein